MLPQTHPLIEAITQPLAGNAEMKLSAAQILEQTFDPDHPSVPQALERLEQLDKRKFPLLGKIAIWVLAVAVLLVAIASDVSFLSAVIDVRRIEFHEVQISPEPRKELTMQERLLLGEPGFDELSQKERLFESDSTNPAYFAEYAQAYMSLNDELPPRFLETATRIDPENSFFLYWAAGQIGKNSIERSIPNQMSGEGADTHASSQPRYVDGVRLRPLPKEQEHAIKDRAAYDEALALIKTASELNKFENYEIMMMKARMRLVLPEEDFADFLRAIVLQYGNTAVGVMSLQSVSRLMNARAEELSKNGQKEDFLSLASQRDSWMSAWSAREYSYLISELVYGAIASGTAVNFHAAAQRLGVEDLTEKYRKQNEGFIAERDFRDLRNKKDNKTETFISERASAISRLSLTMIANQVQTPPVLSDSDLKPMRMVEHELLGRGALLLIALSLLPLSLLLFLFRFAVSGNIRLTAKRFALLIGFSDWIWIFCLGVVIPIIALLYINRFSPMSARNYGASHFLFILPSLHFTVLFLNLLLIPAVVTRWRLSRRAAAFKFGSRLDLLSLPVICIMLVYSIVAYPVLEKYGLNRPVQIGLLAPLVGWLGYVFFSGLRIILGNASSRIMQTATAIAVIPAYPLAIIALCSVLPLYHAGEKYWIAQDKIHLIDPDAPDLGAYEFKIAAQKRKEINTILGIE